MVIKIYGWLIWIKRKFRTEEEKKEYHKNYQRVWQKNNKEKFRELCKSYLIRKKERKAEEEKKMMREYISNLHKLNIKKLKKL